MTLPDKIIEAAEHLPFIDKAQVYAALVAYIASETEPYADMMSENAKAFFDLHIDLLKRILRRRKRDAERRARKRMERDERRKAEFNRAGIPETLPSGVTGLPTPCERIDDSPEMTVPDDTVSFSDIHDPRLKIRAVYRRYSDNTEYRNNVVSYFLDQIFPLKVVVDHNASGYFRLEDRFKKPSRKD